MNETWIQSKQDFPMYKCSFKVCILLLLIITPPSAWNIMVYGTMEKVKLIFFIPKKLFASLISPRRCSWLWFPCFEGNRQRVVGPDALVFPGELLNSCTSKAAWFISSAAAPQDSQLLTCLFQVNIFHNNYAILSFFPFMFLLRGENAGLDRWGFKVHPQ